MKLSLIYEKTLEEQKLNFSRCALFHMKTRVSLKYFVSYCSKNQKTIWKNNLAKGKAKNLILSRLNWREKKHCKKSNLKFLAFYACFGALNKLKRPKISENNSKPAETKKLQNNPKRPKISNSGKSGICYLLSFFKFWAQLPTFGHFGPKIMNFIILRKF